MNDNKLILAGLVVIILCFTGMVTHCTYTEGQCKQEAIRAGIDPAKITTLCHSG